MSRVLAEPREAPHDEPEADDRRWRSAVLGVVGIAVAVRLWILTTPALELDADEAVTGIMVRRILDGHHTAYFAGQNYMGTLEQYAQAAVLAVLPDTAFFLRLPQVALAAVSCLLVALVARRCDLSRARSLLAAGMFAVGPYFLVYWGTKSRGGYAAAMVLGLVGLLLALSTTPEDPGKLLKVALFGFVVGLALWVNQQAAYLLLPSAWWLWASLRDRPARHAAVGTVAALLGALPALWRTATTGSPLLAAVGGDSEPADRAEHLVSVTLPHYLGVRDDADRLLPWLPPSLVVAAAVAALVVALVRRRRGIAAILKLEPVERHGADLLLLVLAIVPVLAIASGASTNAAARFLFVTYPVVLVLLASVPVPRSLRGTSFPAVAAGLAVLALAGHTWLGVQWLIAEDDGGRPDLLGRSITAEQVDGILHALEAADAEVAYADYWVAHPVTWRADGNVVVESVYQHRFPHISAIAHAHPSPAFVVPADEVKLLRDHLEDRGVRFRATEAVGGWWVFTDVVPGLHPTTAPTVTHGLAWAE